MIYVFVSQNFLVTSGPESRVFTCFLNVPLIEFQNLFQSRLRSISILRSLHYCNAVLQEGRHAHATARGERVRRLWQPPARRGARQAEASRAG